jgi:hypothetical protein
MDIILASREIRNDQAAFFVLGAAEVLPAGELTAEGAFALAKEQKWLSRNAQPYDPARLEEVSLLVMGAFHFRGGLMYSLFPTPHFAYREMVYKRLLQGRNDPAVTLSGERLLRIIGRALDFNGSDQRLAQEMQDAAAEARRQGLMATVLRSFENLTEDTSNLGAQSENIEDIETPMDIAD